MKTWVSVDRTGQVWEGLNVDHDIAMFLFLNITKKYKPNPTWNEWNTIDLLTGVHHVLRLWRDSPLENPSSSFAGKWRRVV